MENIIEPNIHPILVHFAYALSITAFISYVLAPVSYPPGRKAHPREIREFLSRPAIRSTSPLDTAPSVSAVGQGTPSQSTARCPDRSYAFARTRNFPCG